MIPLFKVMMSNNAKQNVGKILASGFIGQGQVVEEFENKLWEELKCKTRPVTVNSCTSAIDLALELVNVGVGDEVILTPQTCFASNIGAIHRGAKIRWADIDPITGLMDSKSVENLITKKTKAIVAVNWAGKICDYKSLKKYGIPVIEDAAHCWDVLLDNNIERGDYICYSFQAIKFLTAGDGGILVCPEEKENEARILRWYGLDRTKSENFRCTQNIMRVGFKYHMNDINASIGLSNVTCARKSVYRSTKNSNFYIKNVNNNKLVMPAWDPFCSYWLFSMHVLDNKKELFQKYMLDNGIATSPVHFRNDRYDSTMQYLENDLPGVDSFTKTQICIPNGWWINKKDKIHITRLLNEF